MLALRSRYNRGVADQGIVDSRVGDEVGLELVKIDVESAIKAQRGGDGADDLGNQAVEVFVRRPGDIEVTATDIVDGFIVDEECAVRVLNGAMGRKNSIVGLNNSRAGARRRVDGELKLGLLAVLGSKALQHQGTESRAGTATERVEDEESLERLAVVLNTKVQSQLRSFNHT